MSILDRSIQCQISDLSEACEKYWELRGVAQNDRREMQRELEQHFIQAALDGKSLDVVVGRNPAAFAHAWAREMHPRILRGGEAILPGLIYALSVVSTTALFQLVITHTSSFTLTLFMAYVLVGSGLLALLVPLGGFLAPRIKTRKERAILFCIVMSLVGLALRGVGLRVNWRMALLSWNWPLTLLLLALAVGLTCLEVWRRGSQKRTSSPGCVKRGHAMLMLAGNVILFDLFLGVSSMLVLNSCVLVGRVF